MVLRWGLGWSMRTLQMQLGLPGLFPSYFGLGGVFDLGRLDRTVRSLLLMCVTLA